MWREELSRYVLLPCQYVRSTAQQALCTPSPTLRGPSGQGLQLAGALRVLTLNRKNYLERRIL